MSELSNLYPSCHEPLQAADEWGNKPFSDVASLISHELRTPLTSIQGVLGLLHQGYFGELSGEGQRLLAIAMHNANRLVRLANAIDHESALAVSILSKFEIELLQLENDLHIAFEHGNLQLFYQPIISIEKGRILGFEALTRWRHPKEGWIPPSVFIPLAEKTDLIHQLGLWSVAHACQQLQLWQQQYPAHPSLTMSVNLSTLQLLQPNLVQQMQQILHTTGVAPDKLKLEITESALIENPDLAIAILSDLRALGIQFYLDDFGTGYSSLARLKDLPIDALKLDRSFISSKKWDISETILSLAEKLGLGVIAEGVETSEEMLSLRALGYSQMQGYLFSKPVNSQTATTLIAMSNECFCHQNSENLELVY